MKFTLTLTGSADELKAVLDAVGGETRLKPLPIEDALRELVEAVTVPGRRVLGAIAEYSGRGEGLPPTALSIRAQLDHVDELHGVLGGIGLHWRKITEQQNPFVLKRRAPGEESYIVDKHVADILRKLLRDRGGQP